MAAMAGPVVQWMIDTRRLWAVDESLLARDQVQQLWTTASDALALLTADEQQAVRRFYHVSDAKMNLVSALLKRYAIVGLCDVPWATAQPSRGPYGKPCYVPGTADGDTVTFNVSHQAGLVVLVASSGGQVDVGIDVVCVHERNDRGHIDRDGFFAWVDVYSDVFAPAEVRAIKYDVDGLGLPATLDLSGGGRDAVASCQHRSGQLAWITSAGQPQRLACDVVVDAKLRRFYACWCLREAYVKMTGEALLADWLQRLQFRDVVAPAAAPAAADNSGLLPGEVIPAVDVYLDGRRVAGVTVELRAFGCDYMVATAARPRGGGNNSGIVFPGFTTLDFGRDIAPAAV